jgi:hypothetical protein
MTYELDGDDGIREQDNDDCDARRMFARTGSALRASSRRNPRNLPCPHCGQPNKLTPADKRAGYQCDDCADREEGCGY